jgi:hypothetical protein
LVCDLNEEEQEMKKLIISALCAATLAIGGAAHAQYLMMPDSTNNRLVLFNPVDGSVVNPNAFMLAGGTPIHALQVGNEIWVSEQIGDRISRWDMAGNSVGSISGGLDNVRGMALINDTVYLCNDGTGNGAPGPSLHMFSTAGASMGFFATASTTGPFDILAYGNNILVSSDAANDDIHQYTLAGASVGTFHNSTGLNFAEQMDYGHDGNILVAGFSSNMIVRLNYNTGAIVTTYAASGARGVWQLDNGNILWSNSAGAHVLDPNTGISTQVYAGGGRFFDFVNIPAPGALALLGLGGLVGSRRRRN